MNLTYSERLVLIDLTQTRLAKMRLYVAPAKPCNDNQNWDNQNWDNFNGDNFNGDADNCNPCLRLADKVGSSWQIRRASLLAVAKRPPEMSAFTTEGVS